MAEIISQFIRITEKIYIIMIRSVMACHDLHCSSSLTSSLISFFYLLFFFVDAGIK